VISPYLFALYIESVVDVIKSHGLGCYIKAVCVSIFLYADDILLLAPSLSCLEQLIHICELELEWLDLTINAKSPHVYALALGLMSDVATSPLRLDMK